MHILIYSVASPDKSHRDKFCPLPALRSTQGEAGWQYKKFISVAKNSNKNRYFIRHRTGRIW